MGEFLRARLTKEMSEKLEEMIEETKKKAPLADVSGASITRHALEACINDYDNQKTHEHFKVTLPNMKSIENLEKAREQLFGLSMEAITNKELSQFYEGLATAIRKELNHFQELEVTKKELERAKQRLKKVLEEK